MADNITLDAGSGGSDVATDQKTGTLEHYQKVKIVWGVDDTFNDVTSTATLPFPVALSDTDNAVLDTIDAAIDTMSAKFASGTVIGDVNLGATDNAVLDAIAASVAGTVTVDMGANNDVTVTSGAITETNSTAILADTAAMDTNLATLAGAVSGSEIQVDIVSGGTGSTQYAEDAVHGSGDTGTLALVVRNDTLASLVDTDGDNAPLQVNASGALYVEISGGVVNALADDADFTATTTEGLGVVGVYESSPTSVTDGDVGFFGITSTRAVKVGGADATNLGKTQDVASGANDVGVAMLAVRDDEQAAMTPVDGDYSTLRTDKFGNLKVTQLPDATSVVKFAIINASSSGDNTIQAAAGAGIKIRVLSAFIVAAGTVAVRFESGAAGTALTGQMPLVANSGFTLPYNPAGWFETADNALLNLELGGAIAVHGSISYVEV